MAIGALSIYFTDLSSDSGFFAVFLPIIIILSAILFIVTGFGLLFQKEYEHDYQTHASVDRKETSLSSWLPNDAKIVEQKITEEKKTVSTHTVKYVNGKKIQDSYEETSS